MGKKMRYNDYEAYCAKYDFVFNNIKAKNVYMTAKYSEEEFTEIYAKIKQNRLDLKRDRIVQYIVYRQKRYFDLY